MITYLIIIMVREKLKVGKNRREASFCYLSDYFYGKDDLFLSIVILLEYFAFFSKIDNNFVK